MERNRHLIAIVIAVASAAAVQPLLAVRGADGLLAWVLGVVAGVAAYLAARMVIGDGPNPGARADTRHADDQPGELPPLILDLPLAVIVIDQVGRIQAMNIAARETFGEAAPEAPLSSLIRTPALTEAVEAMLATGASGPDSPTTSVDFTLMRAREQRDLVAHLRPVGVGVGQTGPGAMILFEDHTRATRVEQMRRDFIANASHELRTPLASITGFIETLSGPAAGDPEAQARFLPIMAGQAERMARLIDDLMSLNRIELREHVRPSDNVDLAAILAEVVAAMAPQATRAGVAISLDLPGQGLVLTGDRDELSQLFFNLIDNAVKYGGEGEAIRVTMARAEPGRSRMIGITVEDKGPGIAREHLPRLTERFYQVSAARTGGVGAAEPGGTGLGLSIVKHILSRHRGDLAIRSELGEGAAFTAWLLRS